ncbi:unnamed protein product [Caenorhabditis brenneri]
MILFNILFFLVIWTSDARSINKLKPSEENILVEGDILLSKNDLEFRKTTEGRLVAKLKSEPAHSRHLIYKDLGHRWTFPISYHINQNVNASAVLAGIIKWEQETCARFVQQNDSLDSRGLEFISDNICYSDFGTQGDTPHRISIAPGCEGLGTVTHELAHAFGFVHEHKHFKRGAYVVVEYDNINSTNWFDFDMEPESAVEDFGVGYDYGSVMHYWGNAFSKNDNFTIRTIDPNYQSTIGQRDGPSFSDVKKLNFAYCNSTCPNTLNCTRGGYINPNNCNECKCPVGFGGQLCQNFVTNSEGCGKNIILAEERNQTLSTAGAQTCYYLIKAPTNKRVYFNLTKRSFPTDYVCRKAWVEINYTGDFTKTGARYCNFNPTVTHSKNEELLVIYKGVYHSKFALSFHYGDPAPMLRK